MPFFWHTLYPYINGTWWRVIFRDLVMARYERPPMFNEEEDLKDWLESYEEAATHNGWAAAARLANFGLFLAGSAKKWFKNTPQPDTYADVPGVGEEAGRPGMKSNFWRISSQQIMCDCNVNACDIASRAHRSRC